MTSPTGGEHVSRYRALGEFDNLIREAQKARRALRELREEEAKLNAQSLADDKKLTASKQARAQAEKKANEDIAKSLGNVSRNRTVVDRSGDDTGVAYARGFSRGVQRESNNTFQRDFQRTLRSMSDKVSAAGQDTGNRYVMGFASKIRDLNIILGTLGMDKLDLDVSTDDARQSIKALEFELNRLGNVTANPQVRIDTNRALTNLRAIQKLFKDEVAEDIIKESRRIQEELKKVDTLPSGKAFKFWALTALSDMSRVFNEANRGTGVFNRLRAAITASGGGGGNNFIRSLVSGFDDFSESSSNLLQRLGRVSGELYRMPGIIAVLVASLPGLISGFGALVAGAGGLASSLGALSGFLAAGPGLFVAFASGIGATASSFNTLGEALKAAQKAQEAEAEAKEQARLGTDKALTAAQKYKLALAELAPATEKSTLEIVKFADKFADMQERVGERFFKEVVNDFDSLNKTIPILENLLGKAATAVGKITSEGIRMVTSGPWKKDFAIIASNNAVLIQNMGKAALYLVDAFRNITIASGPFTTWVTKSIRDAADAFRDWSAEARRDGTIVAFLDEAKESGKILWQIFKDLGNVVNSFFQSSVDQGQDYLRMLQGVTARWADVAEAQEQANSPLRKWMQDIKPVLTAMGDLVRDFASGIAKMASDQRNIETMIELLNVLRVEVLPPILSILQHLNDSGIAVTVFKAFGDLLQAISDFLDSGATQALTVFVTVLANFAELIFSFASLPVISDILGGLATALAALAAVSVVARFTGLFKLWDFFTWMSRNRGNLAGAFADAARGVAGLQVSGTTVQSGRVPSSIGAIGSEVTSVAPAARATSAMGNAATTAANQTNVFSRALRGVQAAGGVARGALSSLTGFLGGPWGVALIAATALVGIVTNKLIDNQNEAKDTKDAFIALKGAYEDLSSGDTSGVEQLSETNDKFKEITESAATYGITLRDVSGALNNQEQSLTRFNSQIDTQLNSLKAQREAIYEDLRARGVQTGEIGDGTEALNQQIEAAEKYKKQVNDIAGANSRFAQSTGIAADMSRTYQERLAGLSQAQVDNAVRAGEMTSQIQTLSSALDTMSSATATNQDRARALGDIINYETGALQQANESVENFNSALLNLEDAVKSNGRSLSVKTREGLRNRDALEAAAKATRDLYLEDIASGRPMDESIRRHQDRITELRNEARNLGLSREATEKLIKAYGDVPDSVKTTIKPDDKGFAQVYADLKKLQVMQKALQEGKSLAEAEKSWQRESSSLYQRALPEGKYAQGGPVWGAGTRTSDSIRAWLSNGEFVQPTDAVEHYGMPVMEALRTRKLDKAVIQEALPAANSYNSGGPAHSANCPSCASGGHRFARGGMAWPFVVNPENTMINKDWVNNGVGELGGAGGGAGYQWQMQVLRQKFPGLPLISGYRPGSRTLSGNLSYHARGRAVDLPPRRDVAAWIRSTYGAKTKELITPFNDLNLLNGRPHRYTGAIWNQHNFAGGNAHDHWAFNKGGMVDLMSMLGMNNLMPSGVNNSIPTIPRTLSPAASNVVNNTTDNGTTFGDVIINNPQPERGGDSIRNALYRTQYLLG